MLFARIRAIFNPSTEAGLYDQIRKLPSRSQRDELLVMAQRAGLSGRA